MVSIPSSVVPRTTAEPLLRYRGLRLCASVFQTHSTPIWAVVWFLWESLAAAGLRSRVLSHGPARWWNDLLTSRKSSATLLRLAISLISMKSSLQRQHQPAPFILRSTPLLTMNSNDQGKALPHRPSSAYRSPRSHESPTPVSSRSSHPHRFPHSPPSPPLPSSRRAPDVPLPASLIR